jgi:hypothetical protein
VRRCDMDMVLCGLAYLFFWISKGMGFGVREVGEYLFLELGRQEPDLGFTVVLEYPTDWMGFETWAWRFSGVYRWEFWKL